MIQEIAVMFYPYSVFFTTLFSFFLLVFLLFTQFYWITLAYIVWLSFFKSKIEHQVKTLLIIFEIKFIFAIYIVLKRVASQMCHLEIGVCLQSIETIFRVV